MEITVLRSGPMTTVQDEGRFGYLAYGIGQSGAMDKDAYHKANGLVGNGKGEAVLEATLMGPVLRFEQDALLAFMGADMQACIDDMPVARGRAYPVHAGQVVSFGMAKSGVRSYIAVAGGVDVPEVMGSRSTDIKCGIGGFAGRKLADGDILRIFDRNDPPFRIRAYGRRKIIPAGYPSEVTVRAILGPQDDHFTVEGIRTFLETAYTVSSESDRMGIRLNGAQIEGKCAMDIVSDGIAFGSVQVTTAGLPIVLMADHQTTGGYAKIATVISDDLPLLAQTGPGDRVRFQKVEIGEIQRKLRKRRRRKDDE